MEGQQRECALYDFFHVSKTQREEEGMKESASSKKIILDFLKYKSVSDQRVSEGCRNPD